MKVLCSECGKIEEAETDVDLVIEWLEDDLSIEDLRRINHTMIKLMLEDLGLVDDSPGLTPLPN